MNDQQRKNATQMKWTPEQDDMLRNLYAQNLSTALIAERMGFGQEGKNRVIGRSHRLNLPRRPSCIIVNAPAMRAPKPKLIGEGPTLPPLASVVEAVELPPAIERDPQPVEILQIVGAPDPQGPACGSTALLQIVTEPAVEPPPVLASPPTNRCAFPLWNDRERPTHKYCGDPVAVRSYCAAHSAIAYVGLRRGPFNHYNY